MFPFPVTAITIENSPLQLPSSTIPPMPTNTGPSAPTLQDQLVDESCSMVRHLVGKGMRAPAALVQAAAGYESARNTSQPIDLAALATLHERLAKLVAPASPS
ncbi:MAG TPA: hypothetical protein VGB24_23710, partial [Longimicrobium sp.]